ncbi:hypothetical protein NDU88_006188 [Pleurodeles waltl]|uniref:Uncharacterized protein n=1 Tax=Pleurodeles waltl TaxID=8319 RepID=A0AAV7X303_PLEWA|nr:hypothetical protein NDU88_006188 [Pleurodeles waltl]
MVKHSGKKVGGESVIPKSAGGALFHREVTGLSLADLDRGMVTKCKDQVRKIGAAQRFPPALTQGRRLRQGEGVRVAEEEEMVFPVVCGWGYDTPVTEYCTRKV